MACGANQASCGPSSTRRRTGPSGVRRRSRDGEAGARTRAPLDHRAARDRPACSGAAFEPAHPADEVRRPAADHRRRRHAAGDARRRRGLRPAARRNAAGRRRESRTASRRPRPAPLTVIANSAPATAAQTGRSTVSSGPISVTSSVAASSRIADQRVGQTMREDVHRAGDRHAGRLMAPAPQVLDGGQQTRAAPLSASLRSCRRPLAEQRPLPRRHRHEADPVASLDQRRARPSGVEHPPRRAADEPPTTRALDGIDTGLPAGDADAAGRHRRSRRLRASASRSPRPPRRGRRSRAGSRACRRGRPRRCGGGRPHQVCTGQTPPRPRDRGRAGRRRSPGSRPDGRPPPAPDRRPRPAPPPVRRRRRRGAAGRRVRRRRHTRRRRRAPPTARPRRGSSPSRRRGR